MFSEENIFGIWMITFYPDFVECWDVCRVTSRHVALAPRLPRQGQILSRPSSSLMEGDEEPYRPNAGVFVYLLQRKMWHYSLFQLKLDPQSTWSSMSAISWLGWKTSFSSLDADADIGVFDDLKNISLIFLCFNVSVFSMIFLWSQSGWRTRGTGFGTPWVKKYKIFCHRTARFYFSPSKLTRNLDFVSF